MADITLSSVRDGLLSLQNTTDLIGRTQNRRRPVSNRGRHRRPDQQLPGKGVG